MKPLSTIKCYQATIRLWHDLAHMGHALVVALILLGSAVFSQCEWLPIGPDDNNWHSYRMTNSTSLALDASGNPVVGYQDVAHGENASVKRCDGTHKQEIGTTEFSAGKARGTSLSLNTAFALRHIN